MLTADQYDVKQNGREKDVRRTESDHLKGPRRRKNTNKKSELIFEDTSGFSLNDGSVQNTRTTDSVYSRQTTYDSEEIDDLVLFNASTFNNNTDGIHFSSFICTSSTNSSDEIHDLAYWVKTDTWLQITPVNKNYSCQETDPIIDKSVFEDLKKAFNDPPIDKLIQIIRCFDTLPVPVGGWETEELERERHNFTLCHHLSNKQVDRLQFIRRRILNRTSYGFLFINSDDQFFVVTNKHGNNRRSAVKGHPTIKPNSTWEHPWETAVREASEELQYWNDTKGEWRSYNIEEHSGMVNRLGYLECLVRNDYQTNTYNRLIGLFVVRLKTAVTFKVRDGTELADEIEWIPLERKICPSQFYTVYPFIEYLRNNPEFLTR